MQDIRSAAPRGISSPAYGPMYLDWPIADLSEAEIKVLAVLSAHSNAKTGMSHPSVTTIAKRAGVVRQTVFSALKGLERRGIMERRSGRGCKRTNQYRLIAPNGRAPLTIPNHERSLPTDHNGRSVETVIVAPERHRTEMLTEKGTALNAESVRTQRARTIEELTAGEEGLKTIRGILGLRQ